MDAFESPASREKSSSTPPHGSPSDLSGQPAATPGPDLSPVRIHVSVHGASLLILAIVAFVFALQWAQAFFIPLIFGIFISYTLTPLVKWLERVKIPRVIGVTLVMIVLMGSAAGAMGSLSGQFQSIVDELPLATHQLSSALKKLHGGQLGNLKKIQEAAKEIQKAASPSGDEEAGSVAARPEPASVAPSAPATQAPSDFSISDWLWKGSWGAAGFLSQMVMVLFLVFFLLLSGDTFKRKLVKLTGPSLSQKKITVQILDDINISIQRYMFMLLLTNVLLGLCIWAFLSLMGLENAGAWAAASALLHIIPYFGSLLIAVTTGLAAFLQFGSFSMMLLAGLGTLAVAILIGFIVTTWMTGRIAKMNPAAVFIALLFGGWLWGVWGLLLVVPLVVVVKVISTHIEGMQAIAELLGE